MRGAARTKTRGERARFLQIGLPSIFSNFPSRFPHGSIFVAGFIQHGVGVIDVNIQLPRDAETSELAQTPVFASDGDMSHLPRQLARSTDSSQFVVAVERSIEEQQIRLFQPLPKRLCDGSDGRRINHLSP